MIDSQMCTARPETATKRAAVGSTSDAWETWTPPGVKKNGDSPQRRRERRDVKGRLEAEECRFAPALGLGA